MVRELALDDGRDDGKVLSWRFRCSLQSDDKGSSVLVLYCNDPDSHISEHCTKLTIAENGEITLLPLGVMPQSGVSSETLITAGT
jgi:hypothetical protein